MAEKKLTIKEKVINKKNKILKKADINKLKFRVSFYLLGLLILIGTFTSITVNETIGAYLFVGTLLILGLLIHGFKKYIYFDIRRLFDSIFNLINGDKKNILKIKKKIGEFYHFIITIFLCLLVFYYIYTYITNYEIVSFSKFKTIFLSIIKNNFLILFSQSILFLGMLKYIRYIAAFIYKNAYIGAVIGIFIMLFLLFKGHLNYLGLFTMNILWFKLSFLELFLLILMIFLGLSEFKFLGIIDLGSFLRDKDKEEYYHETFKKSYNKNITEGFYEHQDIYLENLDFFKDKGNFIEPISDNPIGIKDENIFKNEYFAKNIYNLLNGINFKEFKKSYSIGIVGEWGGGKSSIINLLDEQFLDGNPNFQVLKFNPWDYKTDNLINNFFGELGKVLGGRDTFKLIKKYLGLVGNINNGFQIGTDFISNFLGDKSLEIIKEDIDKKLKNNGRKIVVIIDDLDRCEPNEVLLMLNLIKNLGDFNNIIYLVSYDKDHVIEVLEEKKFNGDYIEKIINIERFIPIPDKVQLKAYFDDNFQNILKNIQKNNKKLFNEKKREEITKYFTKGFDDFFEKENLRFIKKLLNHLNIILQLNLEKENFEIAKLSNEDFKLIFIINYCKLKDFKLFSEVTKIMRLSFMMNRAEVWMNKEDLSSNLMNIENMYIFGYFYSEMLFLRRRYEEAPKKYIITNNYLRYKDYVEEEKHTDSEIITKYKLGKMSLELLKKFS